MLTGCAQSAAQQSRLPAPTEVVATVGSTSITLAQVDEKALQQSTGNFGSMKLAQALFEARRIAIEELIEDALLEQDAKARKLDPAKVIEQEITAKVAEPTDADAATWFSQNQSRLQGATLDQARLAIKGFLVQQRTQAARQQYHGRSAGEGRHAHHAGSAAADRREGGPPGQRARRTRRSRSSSFRISSARSV